MPDGRHEGLRLSRDMSAGCENSCLLLVQWRGVGACPHNPPLLLVTAAALQIGPAAKRQEILSVSNRLIDQPGFPS